MKLLRLQQYIQRVFHIYGQALPGNYTKKKLENLRELFVISNDFLSGLQIEYWMDFGTLLGYHRESGFIPHDVDVDFGMHEKWYAIILKEKTRLPKNVRMYDTSKNHRGPKIYLSYKGIDCDFYFYQQKEGKIRSTENSAYPNESQWIDKELIYPLKEVEMMECPAFVPNQTKAYLEFIYGYLGRGGNRDKKTGFWLPPG